MIMGNPLTYGGRQPNVATAPNAGTNTVPPTNVNTKSTLYLPEPRLQTERYADITPFFVKNTVPDDNMKYACNVDQRPQQTFVSPIMSTFTKRRSYFFVPRSCIYKEIWHQVFVNPKKGDDIVFKDVVASFDPDRLNSFFRDIRVSPKTSAPYSVGLNGFILWLFYRIYGPDSLMAYLREPLAPAVLRVPNSTLTGPDDVQYESLIQRFIRVLNTLGESADDGSTLFGFWKTGGTSLTQVYYPLTELGIRRMFDDFDGGFYDNPTSNSVSAWPVLGTYTVSDGSFTPWSPEQSVTLGQGIGLFPSFTYPVMESDQSNINIERLIAYQMVCAQFYSNDNVDDIYTSDLWYQNMRALSSSAILEVQSYEDMTFSWNGVNLLYAPYSGKIFYIILVISGTVDYQVDTALYSALFYLAELFTQHHSLRYGDMFVGGRLEPLAVGDVVAPVSANAVSAVDMTKATLMQRFLNNVNVVRNTIEGYSKMLFGVTPDDLLPSPRFIASSEVDFQSTLTTNSAQDQGAQNVQISLHDSTVEFDIHTNSPGIVLGLCTYSCLQPYAMAADAEAFKIDRMDEFNPMLQNIGDQPVYSRLLQLGLGMWTSSQIICYNQNDIEYKATYGTAVGGFVDGSLGSPNQPASSPSTWAMIRNLSTSAWRDSVNWLPFVYDYPQLSSTFIRNRNHEFDVFYGSLSGAGSSYYHFVCSYVNEVTMSRPMKYVSSILF